MNKTHTDVEGIVEVDEIVDKYWGKHLTLTLSRELEQDIRKALQSQATIAECVRIAEGGLMKELYQYLITKEAVIAKSGIQSDYENGYFDAIDDIAKHVSQEYGVDLSDKKK
jgi:hypothetical protein